MSKTAGISRRRKVDRTNLPTPAAGSKRKETSVDQAGRDRRGSDPAASTGTNQMVLGTVNLHGTGKTTRVLLLVGEKGHDAAVAAGADVVRVTI